MPIAAEIQVAVTTAVFAIAAGEFSPRIIGFRNMMYAIAKNVVSPAMISVFTFVPCSFSLNIFSILICPPSENAMLQTLNYTHGQKDLPNFNMLNLSDFEYKFKCRNNFAYR